VLFGIAANAGVFDEYSSSAKRGTEAYGERA
jgi:hypothetical protein